MSRPVMRDVDKLNLFLAMHSPSQGQRADEFKALDPADPIDKAERQFDAWVDRLRPGNSLSRRNPPSGAHNSQD